MGLRKAPALLHTVRPRVPTWHADLSFHDPCDLMGWPFFSLSKRPRTDPIIYDIGHVYVRVAPGCDRGIATIWDADILIWVATFIINAMKAGRPFSDTVRFHPYTLLRAIARHTGQHNYRLLEEGLERLHATSVTTTVRANHFERHAQFHWLDSWEIEPRESDGQPWGWVVTLSKWMYEGIMQKQGVLTIHKDYFRLTGGFERWLYRVARKLGDKRKGGWPVTMSELYAKSGSPDRFTNFCRRIRNIVRCNVLPEYTLSIAVSFGQEETLFIQPRTPYAVAATELATIHDRF